jgi:Spy/CpxP family protein refolding chaperone
MILNCIRTLLLCLIGSVAVYGQNRANFPWWNSPVVSDLGLSPEQTQKIREIVRSHRGRLLDSRNAVQKAEGDLEDLLNNPEVNPDQARPIIERLAAARANSTRVFLEMSVQLRSVLTLDQWRILVRRWDEVQRKKPSDTQVAP